MTDPKVRIHRAKFTPGTTTLPNETIRDPDLTWEGSGLLNFLLSLPEDWGVNPPWLVNQRKGGRDRMYRMLRELRERRYVDFIEHRDPVTHQIIEYKYVVYPTPLPEKPDTAEPHTANPHITKDREVRRLESRAPHSPPRGAPSQDMQRIFEAWKSATGRNGTTALDSKRKRAIKDRLGDGFTPEQLIAALTAIPLSDFHNGRDPKTRDHNPAQLRNLTELTLHLRDAKHVEYLLGLANEGGAGVVLTDREPQLDYVPSDEELLAAARRPKGTAPDA